MPTLVPILFGASSAPPLRHNASTKSQASIRSLHEEMSQIEEEGVPQQGGEDLWNDEDEDEDEDEDGLEATLSPISVDRAYLCETAADETDDDKGTRPQTFQRWKIDHNPGNFKYSCKTKARQAQN